MARKSHARTGAAAEPFGRMSEAQLRLADRSVGSQVRFRRISLGLSQQAVSAIMGLTFQQLQKYEHGTNRISGSRLYQLAQILHVPVAFFFENVDAALGKPHEESDPVGQDLPSSVMTKKRTIDLVQAFYAIKSPNEREAAFRLISTMGTASRTDG